MQNASNFPSSNFDSFDSGFELCILTPYSADTYLRVSVYSSGVYFFFYPYLCFNG